MDLQEFLEVVKTGQNFKNFSVDENIEYMLKVLKEAHEIGYKKGFEQGKKIVLAEAVL